MKKYTKRVLILILLVVLYGVGIAGLLYKPTMDLFKSLVPFHLIFSAIILFSFHKDWRQPFISWAIAIYILSYVIELIGVKTNWIFGSYSYGDALGIKVFDVPIVIGLNWLILIYCTANIFYKMKTRRYIKAIFAAVLMVLIDLFIEPVAIYFDFWNWVAMDVPIRNYIAWFIISYIFHISYYYTHFKKSNKIAPGLYLIMLLFFAIINLYIY